MTVLKKTRVTKFKQATASALLHEYDHGLSRLSNLQSIEKQSGHATAVMQDIVEYLDDNELRCVLKVGRFGSVREGMSNPQLITFYEKFDFKVVDPDLPHRGQVMMSRDPASRQNHVL